jgi:uncharacterized protein YcbK (DUF882 family)
LILTPHFNKKEFASKDGAGMPEEVWANVQILARQLEVLRAHLNAPIHINSGYRSKQHNKSIKGSSKNSQHLYGKAADIVVKGYTTEQVYEAIEHLIEIGEMKEGGLGLYETFVHYDIRNSGKARWNG